MFLGNLLALTHAFEGVDVDEDILPGGHDILIERAHHLVDVVGNRADDFIEFGIEGLSHLGKHSRFGGTIMEIEFDVVGDERPMARQHPWMVGVDLRNFVEKHFPPFID